MNSPSFKLPATNGQDLDNIAEKTGDFGRDVKASKDQLLADFKSLATEAEKLLHHSAMSGEAAFEAARATLGEQLAVGRQRLTELEAQTRARARQAALAADAYVHHNPWQSIALAGGVGMMLGALLCSRRGG